ADPIVGLVITAAIVAVAWQAGREVYRRLMDAVDPALTVRAEQVLKQTPGVLGAGQVRLRWIGHRLRAECEVIVDAAASAVQAHQVAVNAEHALLHELPRLSAALVHADPQPRQGRGGSGGPGPAPPRRGARPRRVALRPAGGEWRRLLPSGPGRRDRPHGGAGQFRHGFGREGDNGAGVDLAQHVAVLAAGGF